jgi:putative hydrolase of the HAD superfamily
LVRFECILFDWGSTLAEVVCQDDRVRDGARQIAALIADPNHPTAVESLSARLLAAEAQAAADPELREADLRWHVSGWAGDLDIRVEQTRFEELVDLLGQIWLGSLQPYPGAQPTLAELKRRGYCLGLVSNCMFPPVYCKQELVRMGFAESLQFSVFSSEVGYRKPSPQIYQAALRQAFPQNQPDLSKVLFVGDSPTFDVLAPSRMGMKTAMVRCKKSLWTEADYAQAKPDFCIDAVTELLELLD